MTPSKFFISSPCPRFILRLRFTISPFPTHSPANGYLPCWKGLRFLTGEIDNRTAAKKKARQPREKKRAQMGEKNGKYIIGVGLPGDTDSPSHSPSQL